MAQQFWYVKHDDGRVEGPLPTQTIQARIYAGFLSEDSLVSADKVTFRPARLSLPADDAPVAAQAPAPETEDVPRFEPVDMPPPIEPLPPSTPAAPELPAAPSVPVPEQPAVPAPASTNPASALGGVLVFVGVFLILWGAVGWMGANDAEKLYKGTILEGQKDVETIHSNMKSDAWRKMGWGFLALIAGGVLAGTHNRS